MTPISLLCTNKTKLWNTLRNKHNVYRKCSIWPHGYFDSSTDHYFCRSCFSLLSIFCLLWIVVVSLEAVFLNSSSKRYFLWTAFSPPEGDFVTILCTNLSADMWMDRSLLNCSDHSASTGFCDHGIPANGYTVYPFVKLAGFMKWRSPN